jgi:hypothetical protein
MIEKYLTWFKPNKIDGERPDPDIRSICISLSKFVEFMNENHRDIVTSVNVETGKETTFKNYLFQSFLIKCFLSVKH